MENPNYTEDYNFKRLSKKGENSWDNVLNRFIKAMLDRGCRTTKKDMEWLLLNYYAVPNSPALLTAGNKKLYASACAGFIVKDALDEGQFSILDTLNLAVKTTKAGVGCGYTFSNLRSKTESVQGRTGLTGGVVSFIRAYNGFLKEITQATRQSANMSLLNVNHPDIYEYLDCKSEDEEIANFNLSVNIDDKFMKAVEQDSVYELKYRSDNRPPKAIKAKELFSKICERLYDNGEPGIVFGDTMCRDYFTEWDIDKILLNPCSESLLTYGDDWLELCVLGSVNLPKYVELDLKNRNRVITVLTSLLNDIIDVQDYAVDLQKEGMQNINRKIGIGCAGVATVLAKKEIKYSSSEAYEFTKNTFKELGEFSLGASENLYNIYKDNIDPDSPLHILQRANGSLISEAPTSSLSNIFNDINDEGCSYGIEPYFTLEKYQVSNSYGKFDRQEKIIPYLNNKINHIEVANDLDWISHLKLVEAYYNSNISGIVMGCSKTVNFKENVKLEEIEASLFYCWKHKIKAISFYRSGSRKNEVFQEITKKKSITLDTKNRPLDIAYLKSPKRPEMLCCDIHHITANRQKWIVLVGKFKNKPYEIFAGLEEDIDIPKKHKLGIIEKQKNKYNLVIGETEDDTLRLKNIPRLFLNDEFATSTRLISMALRHGTPLPFLVDQLQKEGTINSINKAISRVLKKYIEDQDESGATCPECKSKMKYISGCLACSCGFTKCS